MYSVYHNWKNQGTSQEILIQVANNSDWSHASQSRTSKHYIKLSRKEKKIYYVRTAFQTIQHKIHNTGKHAH